METPSLSTKAKACRNCVKAKAKCYGIVSPAYRCERCNRLKKECVMPVMQKNRKPLKQTRTAQIAQLEQKLESLTSILSATDQLPASDVASTSNCNSSLDVFSGFSPATVSPTSQDNHRSQAFDIHINSTEVTLPDHQLPHAIECSQSTAAPYQFRSDHYQITGKTPDELLSIFRSELASQVPFVSIPSTMRARDLQVERPFLYQSLMMAAAFNNIEHQMALSKEIMQYLAERIILLGEKSLDLLQGLLVSLSWFYFHVYSSRQLNNFLALMSTLVVDLGISSRSGVIARHDEFANELARGLQGPQPSELGTMDEKRALLGCFYISSWTTSSLSKLDAMRYTPFIKECYESVARSGGQKSDIFLVHAVKLTCIVERIRTSGLCDGVSFGEPQPLRAPARMCVKSFWEELKSFRDSLPEELKDDAPMLKHYYSAEIILLESCFYMSSEPPSYNPHILQRIDIFYGCLYATKSYFDIFLAIPSTSPFTVSLVPCGHMVHAIAVLSKLSLYEADDWDLNYVRRTVDLSAILSRLLERAELTADTFDQPKSENTYDNGARKMRLLKTWYENKLAAADVPCSTNSDLTAAEATNQFDFLSDDFWQGIPGDWDFLQ